MDISKDSIVGELVAQDFRTASVFSESKIDFCCHGNHSLEEACKERQIDCSELIRKLEQVTVHTKDSSVDYNAWPLDFLADYIEKNHHHYVERKIQEIILYLDKIIAVHGNRHPELAEAGKLFKQTAGEMAAHMKKEELMVFPAIKRMVKAKQEGTKPQKPAGSLKARIEPLLKDHNNEGDNLRKIAELTNNYLTPEDGCNTYSITLAMLKEFENDLHIHIHLENNILFPKSIKMEELMLSA
ncbi:MAG: iron-sulfur cluster repair di-iron protein [Bacteroidia bacterium]|nr:iron-sulfur cluster repair di-iron protein [Bacteroidia bacterium]MCZ2277512.1 iron-sulfur cluster repair di-iron protein [Bacteroidia bacterium]